MSDSLLEKLAGGDRRSIGRVDEVIALVTADPALFGELFGGMTDPNPLVRMRAADAVEKITIKRPEWLQPYKEALLGEVAAVEQQEVRWHLAQLLPRLELTPVERRQALAILHDFLADRSKIVVTFAMQAVADLALKEPALKPEVVPVLQRLTETGSPAMRSRGRKLLKQLADRPS